MNRLTVLAATCLLLPLAACAAEDSATANTVQAQANAATDQAAQPASDAQSPAPRPEAMTREQARDAVQNVAARNIDDPELVARGEQAFKAGRDYLELSPVQRTSSPPDKIEIAEVFMYQCPHCFSFEPFVDSLIKEQPPEVNVIRLPAIFNQVAELHAKAFYASKALGVWEQLHMPFFREIHTNRNLMRTEDQLLDFIERQGIERESFANTMRSFEVDSKIRDARDLNRRYRVQSVPTVVINGKYVTSGSMVGTTDKLKDVIDYLVSKEAASQ